jgi:hypothetical protein
MKAKARSILKIAGRILAAAALGLLFWLKAWGNYSHQDYLNSNFFTFWLSGHMLWAGENPYDRIQWLAGHAAFGATWIPNQIFPYPLPLAFLMVPLGWLSLGPAYIVWQLLSQILIAITVYVLLDRWRGRPPALLFLPLMVFLLFFGPIFLSLQIGSVGPLALGAVLLCILLLERRQSFPAGLALSMTLLKPPQGLTILILAGLWMLARRDGRALAGAGAGGVLLLLLGMIKDPAWPVKFQSAGAAVLDRTLGTHSNVFSFSYLACGQDVRCMWIFGTLGSLALLGLAGYYLWRYRDRLSPWEAFNIILPVGFVSTIYLWSYDQLTYVIPITWIMAKLVEGTRSFVQAFLFLILVEGFAFWALIVQANTHKDRLSIMTTVLTLGLTLFLLHWRPRPAPPA